MNIYIYGDSNTWGYVPNVNGYSKDATASQYDKRDIWWFNLTKNHKVIVNGLCGRAINNENPWLEGRNAFRTLDKDFENINADLIIVQLGTNDCKSKYCLTAQEIVCQMAHLLKRIQIKSTGRILLISPAKIKSGNKVTDKYYVGAENKSQQLDKLYCDLANENDYFFVSGLDLETGEDGEHLTRESHSILGYRVEAIVESLIDKDIEKA